MTGMRFYFFLPQAAVLSKQMLAAMVLNQHRISLFKTVRLQKTCISKINFYIVLSSLCYNLGGLRQLLGWHKVKILYYEIYSRKMPFSAVSLKIC